MTADDRLTLERLSHAYQMAESALLAERNAAGHWEGKLSTSALSTAAAVMALEQVRRHGSKTDDRLPPLISGGLDWLVEQQNKDGGWGDTTKSLSNISTTMLAHAVFHATGTVERFAGTVDAARAHIDQAGGIAAVRARYGKDKTFSIPILTHCALAGLVDWKEVTALPFELACIPAGFYKWVGLPVVSYALPALIAVGQVRHHFHKPLNPLLRLLRRFAIRPSLSLLEKIQPDSGGFLEAAPLTSFVTMSLAGKGLADHPVARQGVEFLVESVRSDGSWPIDTNLATWVTTLSVNALGDELAAADRAPIREWLLGQQYQEVHPYTNADPGGWAWTDLSGGVPDADDTPGAILAVLKLRPDAHSPDAFPPAERKALRLAVGWLLDIQNRNGGWPTFCRGWGALPFDRSAADLTAHAIRALHAWRVRAATSEDAALVRRAENALATGFRYLEQTQRADGAWLPLWFGNQFANDDENPVYGTARVLAGYRETGRLETSQAVRALDWLRSVQNDDGGWGGAAGVPSSIEETALALEVLLSDDRFADACRVGLCWLVEKIEHGQLDQTTPIGFYFAKLWYFETLYPLIFAVSAVRRARDVFTGLAIRDGQHDRIQQSLAD